jgi:hypothetical protein
MWAVGILTRTDEEPSKPQLRLRAHVNEHAIFDNQFLVDFEAELRVRALAQVQGLVVPSSGFLRWSISDDAMEIVD